MVGDVNAEWETVVRGKGDVASGMRRRAVEDCKKKLNKKLQQSKTKKRINVTDVLQALQCKDYILSVMVNTHRCKYCARAFPSMQGQRSHLAQAKKCHERWQADLEKMVIPSHNTLKGHSPRDNDDWPVGIGQDSATNDVLRNANFPDCPEPPANVFEERRGPEETHQDEEGIGPEETHHDEDCHEGIPSKARWRECFPHPAGVRIRQKATAFELLRNAQVARGQSIWGTFFDEGDWEFARWVLQSGTTHASTDKLLELKKVSQKRSRRRLTNAIQIRKASCTSFHNSRSLFQKIDALPSAPKWSCELFEVKGNIQNESGTYETQVVELWRRDPIECLRELIGNPEFKPYLKYAPYRLYTNEEGTEQCWDEMATGSWWWGVQVKA